ncbi:MAG TPA: hypothetical protein VKD70_15430 [Candidatus Acidoferrum sp.]|nr:hypothetical protein [Candidatus Acidoferrum sp.]
MMENIYHAILRRNRSAIKPHAHGNVPQDAREREEHWLVGKKKHAPPKVHPAAMKSPDSVTSMGWN